MVGRDRTKVDDALELIFQTAVDVERVLEVCDLPGDELREVNGVSGAERDTFIIGVSRETAGLHEELAEQVVFAVLQNFELPLLARAELVEKWDAGFALRFGNRGVSEERECAA